MAFHELGHVQANDGVLVVEEEARQLAGELGLAHAGRPQEDERADRAAGVLEAGPGPADGLRDDLDRVLLADQAGVDVLLHAQQAG